MAKAYIGAQDYLESTTNSNYLNTNITSRPQTKIIIGISFVEIPSDSTKYFIGCNVTGSYRISLGITSSGGPSFTYSSGSSGGASVVTPDYSFSINTRYKIEAYWSSGSNYLKINDSEVYRNSTTSSSDNESSIYLFNRHTTSNGAKVKIHYCDIYQNDILIKSLSPKGNGLYDSISGQTILGSGSFNQGISKAKNIKKIYLGINNIAKLVPKGFVGVSSKAKLFFRYKVDMEKVSPVSQLDSGKIRIGSASIGEYVLFAGGTDGSSGYSDVISYNISLVKGSCTSLSNSKEDIGGASTNDYAIFAGGINRSSNTIYKSVNAYNKQLTRSTPTSLTESKSKMGSASVGDYALFAGGYVPSSTSSTYAVKTIDAYNGSLVKTTLNNLYTDAYELSGISIKDYALFAGGFHQNIDSTSKGAAAYNSSLVKISLSDLAHSKRELSGASNFSYGIFAGGRQGDTIYDDADAYSTSLVKTTPTSLYQAVGIASASFYDKAVFAGGKKSSVAEVSNTNLIYNSVHYYDTNLTKTAMPSESRLSQLRYYLTGGKVGNYILFVGGQVGSTYKTNVDAYKQ